MYALLIKKCGIYKRDGEEFWASESPLTAFIYDGFNLVEKQQVMKGKTKIRVGLITAIYLVAYYMYDLGVTLSSSGLTRSFFIVRPIFFAIFASYIYALVKKNLRLAQAAFCIWCSFALIVLVMYLIGTMFTHYLFWYFVICLYCGLIAALLWIGIQGVRQIVEQKNEFQDSKPTLSEKSINT